MARDDPRADESGASGAGDGGQKQDGDGAEASGERQRGEDEQREPRALGREPARIFDIKRMARPSAPSAMAAKADAAIIIMARGPR
jgi:hypothetical protein